MIKEYLPDHVNEIDEDEFEEFFNLTDEQQEAEIDAENKKFDEFLASMTPIQCYRYWRRFLLTAAMANRRRLRDPKTNYIEYCNKIWREGIRKYQLSMLKHRHQLKTGKWPGSA